MKKEKLTHGEAFFERKKAFEQSNTSALNMRAFDTIPPRMDREKALKYYCEKLRKVFGIEHHDKSEFIKPEHYFDVLEAQQILNEMRRVS